MKRIIMHWTAGSHNVGTSDKKHYHFIVDGAGKVHAGNHTPEDNLNTSDGKYAAHTLNANTGSIGVAVAAMHAAKDRPFHPGNYPITDNQLSAFVKLVADLSEKYDIPVERETILTHAEVQPTLGIKQRGKWDITWLPGMFEPEHPVSVGDDIREMIRAQIAPPVFKPEPAKPSSFWAFILSLFGGKK